MSKAIFKVVDSKGRITLPKHLRDYYSIDTGDIVSLTVDSGKISVKKAIVLEDEKMPLDAKLSYVQAVLRELTPDHLAEVLEQTVQLVKALSPPF